MKSIAVGACLHFVVLLCSDSLFGQPPPDSSDSTAEQWKAQIEFLRTASDSGTASKELIAVDRELEESAAATAQLRQSVLIALAEHATPAAREHLHSVFETQTLRRNDAAFAMSIAAQKRPASDRDWQFLVRSLTVVEGSQAVSVLKALRRFQRRATKPAWIREVILIGTALPKEDLQPALDLLQFWTRNTVPDATPEEQLKAWQSWFLRTYPDEPKPVLPVDRPQNKWSHQKLTALIRNLPDDNESLAAGAAVYVKATCNRCHRREGSMQQPPDDRLGPNLTTLGWRRQPKEILSAILYPSHRLNEEYPVTTVILKNGKSHSGLLMADPEGELKIVDANSRETRFRKADIEETTHSRVSNMPEGLLEALSAGEIVELMAYLTHRSGKYDPHRR